MRIVIFIIAVFLTLSFSPSSVVAQTDKEKQEMQKELVNMKKQIADLEKEIEKAKKDDPESVPDKQSELASLKQSLSMMEAAARMMGVTIADNMDNADPYAFPKRKTALLNALPKKTLTKAELITFLTTLHNDLKRKADLETVDSVQAIITKYGNEIPQIAMNGVVAWYQTAPTESILILTYAASKSPTDNILNNCGAVLNLIGMEEKAIPVLKYALPRNGENCTLLNNIGQAFAGLGATDSAMKYFNRVFQSCGTHPDANATAAYIAHANKNDVAAAEYMEKSLTGAFSEERLEFLRAIKPNAKPPVDPDKVNPTEKYFEPNGFTPAPNLKNWSECETVEEKQKKVLESINQLRAGLAHAIQANSLPEILKDPVENANWKTGKGWTPGPFAKKARHLIDELGTLHLEPRGDYVTRLMERIAQFVKQIQEERIAIDAQANAQYTACGTNPRNPPCDQKVAYNHCIALRNLDDKSFQGLASFGDQYQSEWYDKDVKYYNDIIFLMTMTEPNQRSRIASAAPQSIMLLTWIEGYVLSRASSAGRPNCQPPNPAQAANVNNPFFKDGKCLIDVRVPFVVGSMSLNCESFSIEGGEGVTFRYEKNFVSKETTLAVGVGVNADIPGLDIGASAELAVKFDANNQPVDLIGSAQAGMGMTGMTSPVVGVSASVGINSSFTPGFTAFGR